MKGLSKNTEILSFFDPTTHTISYLVTDLESKSCAIIDPVLDYDCTSGATSSAGVDAIIAVVQQRSLALKWILETHIHADHLSSAFYLKSVLGGKIGIGAEVALLREDISQAFNQQHDFDSDAKEFDVLLNDNACLSISEQLTVRALHTPGHTPACMTYQIADALFVGDTLLMPDYGTARCDFPGGSATQLYQSIQRILSFDEDTRLFVCHDYLPEGRSEFKWQTTVGEQKKSNVHIRDGISLTDFTAARTKRDTTLSMPSLMLPSIQVNVHAGNMPKAEENGQVYLKIPINQVKAP